MREGMEMLDILFSGHIHNFCRSFPLKNEELFDRPSQGTIHYMLGNAHNNPPGSRTSPKIWHAAFYHQEERNQMVTIVEVDGSKMTLTALLNDGRIADQCVIDKEGPDTPLRSRSVSIRRGYTTGYVSWSLLRHSSSHSVEVFIARDPCGIHRRRVKRKGQGHLQSLRAYGDLL